VSPKNDLSTTDERNDVVSGQGRDFNSSLAPDGVERMATGTVLAPAVDILESEKAITLLADLPGVERSGVEITLEKRILTLRAKCGVKPPEGYSVLHTEYETGDFERSFTVSDEIDANAISASVRNGMLTLTLPKRAPDKRRIEVGG